MAKIKDRMKKYVADALTKAATNTIAKKAGEELGKAAITTTSKTEEKYPKSEIKETGVKVTNPDNKTEILSPIGTNYLKNGRRKYSADYKIFADEYTSRMKDAEEKNDTKKYEESKTFAESYRKKARKAELQEELYGDSSNHDEPNENIVS